MLNDRHNWRKTLNAFLSVHEVYQNITDQSGAFSQAVVKPNTRRLSVLIQECRKQLGEFNKHWEV